MFAQEGTYYVSTDRAEGIGPTRIQVSAVHMEQNLDVVETVRLKHKVSKKSTTKSGNQVFWVPTDKYLAV